MTHASSATIRHRLVAIGGSVAFAAAILYFARCYSGRYAVVADASAGVVAPALFNVMLLTVFALHHSVFARAGTKAWMARWLPADLERSVYVWVASALFATLAALWLPVADAVWRVEGALAWLLHGLQVAGLLVGVDAGRRADAMELAGLRQTFEPRQRSSQLVQDGPYALVRHPLQLTVLLLLWPVPFMTGTRFVFALGATIYVLIGIHFEERDLRRTFGASYDAYAAKVKYRLVPGVY